MAVYKIFPEKDATLYSEVPYANTGKDEILEIAGYTDSTGVGRTARSLLKFNTSDIHAVVSSNIPSNQFSASLNLFLADASEIPVDFKIYCYSVSQSWEGGVGKFGDIPMDQSGVSWYYSNPYTKTGWSESNITDFNTLYVQPSYVETGYILGDSETIESDQNIVGGGSWVGQINLINLFTTQSFELNSQLDLNLDVTNPIKQFLTGSISNNGFLLKLENKYEFNTSSSIRLKYFSSDTNTIYPPHLTLKWDDSSYTTGSLPLVDTNNLILTLKNNKTNYLREEKVRFRIGTKPKYPTRSFTTSSIYTEIYALPENSYWCIKDQNTEEDVIEFDHSSTKISCDSKGPYFDVYMNGLQPERYYKVLFKTEIDNSVLIFDDNNIFKVVNNG